MIYVFAGNAGEYKYWLNTNKLNPKFFEYVVGVEKIYGLPRNSLYCLVGQYYLNPKWPMYYDIIETRDMTQASMESIQMAQQIINDARCTL